MLVGIYLIFICQGIVFSASVILNEYNAVASSEFLNGGNAAVDEDGKRASDVYFGRIQGNGGDWFELVVTGDHVDMRGWKFEIYQGGSLDETLVLTNNDIWSDLRSGTIITVSEDVPCDVSYNPGAGDWWINVQANDTATGTYIEASNFPVASDDWQLIIRNSYNQLVFGPAGEGVNPLDGIGNTEIFRLEKDPSVFITRDSPDYDDGRDFSTFGAPNQWGAQDFADLRNVVPEAANLALLWPVGGETLQAGRSYNLLWQTTGPVDDVIIEFSPNNGISWSAVYPPNSGNPGSYNWLVPSVESGLCRIRLSSKTNFSVYAVNALPFTIYTCHLPGDVTADCIVDLADLAVLAADWLLDGYPFD